MSLESKNATQAAADATQPVSGHLRFLGDLLAGSITAVVFYAEYLSLGATLGSSVTGGAGASATGTLLVAGAVGLCSISALAWRLPLPLLSGPRAASLLLMIFGVEWVRAHSAATLNSQHTVMLAMALMLVISSGVQLLGLFTKVQVYVANADKWVTRGFLFITAVGIVGQMVKNQLSGCLLFDFWPAALVFSFSLGLATAWTLFCEREKHLKRLKMLSMFIGMGVAWAGYVLLLPSATSATGCGTLGAIGLKWNMLTERIPGIDEMPAALHGMSLLNWLVIGLVGGAMGLVQLIETLTALESVSSARTRPELWRRYIAAGVTANLLAAPVGMSGSSLSGSRSTAAAEAQGRSGMTVLVHGMVLAMLLVLASGFIARIPVLAIAVALALVAVQMIDDVTRKEVWERGYHPEASSQEVHSTWLFWLVLLAGFCSGHAIIGLLAGGAVMMCVRWTKKRGIARAN